MVRMAEAWKLAKDNIDKAQDAQKRKYDAKRAEVDLKVGERVMVFMPSETQGQNRKLARPFHGPYRVLALTPTNAEVCLVDDPKQDSIFVALDRVRRCYTELGNSTWTGPRKKRRRAKKSRQSQGTAQASVPAAPRAGPVTRSMTRGHPALTESWVTIVCVVFSVFTFGLCQVEGDFEVKRGEL